MEDRHEHLAAAIDSSGAAVIVVDLDRRIVAWNRGAEQLLGWPAEEAVGSTPPDRRRRRREPDGVDARHRTSTRPPCGATARRSCLSVNGSPVHDASGEVIGSTWVAFDVTASAAPTASGRCEPPSSPSSPS